MKTKKTIKASPEPVLPVKHDSSEGGENVEHPASNATQPLAKARVRRKAGTDQALLLEKGPNALPVSDYPLKKGPLAANSLDLEEQALARSRAHD